jgi:hypothetical protein
MRDVWYCPFSKGLKPWREQYSLDGYKSLDCTCKTSIPGRKGFMNHLFFKEDPAHRATWVYLRALYPALKELPVPSERGQGKKRKKVPEGPSGKKEWKRSSY